MNQSNQQTTTATNTITNTTNANTNNASSVAYVQDVTVVLAALHISVFVVGIVGNFLVCFSVYKNKSLQTVTNTYIVNLAIADFLVILICLPPTLVWDLTLTWYFGQAMCKLVLYLQSISVSVSVMTLTCISIDRWYAICKPLHFNSTKKRARITIVCIWIASMMIASPDAIFLITKPLGSDDDDDASNNNNNNANSDDSTIYVDCTYSWPETNTQIYQLLLVLLLYITPLLLMTVSYSQIVSVLWRNKAVGQQSFTSSNSSNQQQQFAVNSTNVANADDGHTLHSQSACVQNQQQDWRERPLNNQQQHRMSIASQSLDATCSSTTVKATTNNEARFCKLIESRKKAAKMLIVIMILFGLCYLPVHFLNLLRNTIGLPQNDAITIASLISHWLCYFNSALNPIIYNVMNSTFRSEFANFFYCKYCKQHKQRLTHQQQQQQQHQKNITCNLKKNYHSAASNNLAGISEVENPNFGSMIDINAANNQHSIIIHKQTKIVNCNINEPATITSTSKLTLTTATNKFPTIVANRCNSQQL